jgi:hypothetical protein
MAFAGFVQIKGLFAEHFYQPPPGLLRSDAKKILGNRWLKAFFRSGKPAKQKHRIFAGPWRTVAT